MRVLWITNIVFPEALALLKGKDAVKSFGGGWMISSAEALVRQSDMKLTVASVSQDIKRLTRLEGKSIEYYLLPYGKGNLRVNRDYEPYWKEIQNAVKPDVVHIHGTEFTHGLAYIEACGADRVCVSIQGLIGACADYYYYGLTRQEIRFASTPASLLHGGVLKGCRAFRKRAESEKEILRRVNHIIGRTQWDRQRTWAINPNAQYHYCGETLRSNFYTEPIWDYSQCTPHSIFLSQAVYPLKGLHMVLRAMPLVLRQYPDATVRIAGNDITRSSSWLERMKLSDWGNIVRRLIRENNLQKKIVFTGTLDGDGMRREYLKSNVFVCPSSVENSPNSLGEAQLLGVPVLASYVGGVMDLMRGDEQHLYRFEETDVLAYKICQVFEQQGNIDTSAMREVALERHDPDNNIKSLLEVYHSIIDERSMVV